MKLARQEQHGKLSHDYLWATITNFHEHKQIILQSLTFEAGAKYHVSPALIAAIIVCESSTRPNVISKGGDYGLMQVRYRVHKVKNLLNPRVNIFTGTRILAQYRKGRTLKAALKRYSGGSKRYANKILKVMRKIDNWIDSLNDS